MSMYVEHLDTGVIGFKASLSRMNFRIFSSSRRLSSYSFEFHSTLSFYLVKYLLLQIWIWLVEFQLEFISVQTTSSISKQCPSYFLIFIYLN
uniref:Uncharacterized protein n=1 Tax=Nelumbo nucifera TaxID=4432 RepID=A0A822ZCW0_NELNU|nr:TPA_asm: hypothetical protein HUJ06_000580 [Nelumbo nucifera]